MSGQLCKFCGVSFLEGEKQHTCPEACVGMILEELAERITEERASLAFAAPELWSVKLEQLLQEIHVAERILFRLAFRMGS